MTEKNISRGVQCLLFIRLWSFDGKKHWTKYFDLCQFRPAINGE